MSKPSLHERLRNALFLIPYVVRNQGVPAGELAQRLGLTVEQLSKELTILSLAGIPPWGPDNLIDIYEEHGKVYVDLDQSLARVPRLNLFEAVALMAAASPYLEDERGGAAAAPLRKALERLQRAIPEAFADMAKALASRVAMVHEAGVGNQLALLRRAADERLEVDLEYYSASRDEVRQRTVRPWGLVARNGLWYLVAWCTWRKQPRIFRLSRIGRLELSERIFDAPPADFDCGEFVDRAMAIPASGSRAFRIHFSAEVAGWVRQNWPPERLQEDSDGSLVLTLFDVTEEFVLSLAASYAGQARVVEPPGLAERQAAEAREALELQAAAASQEREEKK